MTCRGDLECDSVAAALDSRTIRDQSVDSPTRTAGTKSGSSATVLPNASRVPGCDRTLR